MMCFRDMTFCEEIGCKKFDECFRALTDKVHEDAKKWWGKEGAPMSVFAEKPDCFVGQETEDLGVSEGNVRKSEKSGVGGALNVL